MRSVKLHRKKKIEIVYSFNGIPITCRLKMEFFSHKSEIIAVCHVLVAQSTVKGLFHVTRVISSEREFRRGLSQFHRRNKVKQGHKVQKINCRPDYILERIDIWCRF